MKRRSFLKALFAAPAVPYVPVAVSASPTASQALYPPPAGPITRYCRDDAVWWVDANGNTCVSMPTIGWMDRLEMESA